MRMWPFVLLTIATIASSACLAPIDSESRPPVDTTTTPKLLKLIETGKLDPTPFATHRFALEDAEQAYDVFGAAVDSHALKVVLEAAPVARELVERHEVPVTA